MLISVGVYSTSNEKPKVKDNVHNKYVPNESQKKTAENSKTSRNNKLKINQLAGLTDATAFLTVHHSPPKYKVPSSSPKVIANSKSIIVLLQLVANFFAFFIDPVPGIQTACG